MSFLVRKNIRLLVCDMAGTTINEKGVIHKALKNTLKRMGYEVNNKDTESWRGKDKRQILYGHIYKQNLDPPGIINVAPMVRQAEKNLMIELEKCYFEDGVELIDDGLLDFFDNIRIRGVKVALNTGYPKHFQDKIIKNLGLENNVNSWISSEDTKYGRPAPYMIHRLMEENLIDSVNQVAKVGDSVNDMLEGKNAGCGLVVGVLTGSGNKDDLLYHADVVVNKITDLRKDGLFYL